MKMFIKWCVLFLSVGGIEPPSTAEEVLFLEDESDYEEIVEEEPEEVMKNIS